MTLHERFLDLNKNGERDRKIWLIEYSANYNDDVIDGMFESAKGHDKKILKSSVDQESNIESSDVLTDQQKNDLIMSLEDDRYISSKTTELMGEMQIIALCKTVEISINNMLATSDLFTPDQLKTFFRFEELKKQLKLNDKVVDIETLNGFKAYNEVRCISNCIKHGGIVNDRLAHYPSWVEGKQINNLNPIYERLKPEVKTFVDSLKVELIKKII